MLKIADFLKAGCEVTILIADVHAYLDNMKSTLELIEYRIHYYEAMIKAILKVINVPLSKLRFIRGSNFQKSDMYTMDLYKLSTLTSLHDAKKAGSEVVKQVDNPKLSGLIYPLMQALDEEYLDVDIQFGGVDQRKIFTLAVECLPLIGHKKRIHLMNPMLTAINAMPVTVPVVSTEVSPEVPSTPSFATNITDLQKVIEQMEDTTKPIDQEAIIANLTSALEKLKQASTKPNISETKMSSSNLDSKIDLLDTNNAIKKKVNRAYCLEGDISFNPLMELTRMVIFPMLEYIGLESFDVVRDEKYGGIVNYKTFEQLQTDFIEKKLHPADFKQTVTSYLNKFIEPIRAEFATPEMVALVKNAYP